MRTLYVTGCNSEYFITTLAFLESFADRFPTADMRVCDFGMTEGQRGLLRDAGHLLERPPELVPGAHPYLCKAHLLGYLGDAAWDAVLWLDSDILPGTLDAAAVEGLADRLRGAGKLLAATGTIDGLSVSATFADLRRRNHRITPAELLFEQTGVNRSHPYLSAGLLLFVSRDLLAEWAPACRAVAPHPLWEQNVLNALVWRDPGTVEVLDPWIWQVYDAPLAEVRVPDPGDPHGLILRDRPVMTVHASSHQGHHVDARIALNFGGERLAGPMRTFANPALQQIHFKFLAGAVSRRRHALRAAGVLRPQNEGAV
ncbi:hypothetical protein [Azospirillum sp. SYSU D00513]|uniref:hypothetical protein n=1 Tax=Azospirillum sp. SYSU D00513 TaxID=2812561 RepID=UPI001A958BA1|nr:hypothetical protein [Azospirillum sp. SYSU D00513]